MPVPRLRPAGLASPLIRLFPLLFSLLASLARASPLYPSSLSLDTAIGGTTLKREHELTKAEYVEKLVISGGLVLLGGVFAG